jgi:hypothetical protein
MLVGDDKNEQLLSDFNLNMSQQKLKTTIGLKKSILCIDCRKQNDTI